MSSVREKSTNNSAVIHSLCCNIIESIQKDVLLLQREIYKLAPLEEQYRDRLKEFFQLTQLVDAKLYALWTAASQCEPSKAAKARDFVHTATTVWKSGDEEIRKMLKNTQLVSQNRPDIPLQEFILATHAHFCGLKRHFDSIPRHSRCFQIAYSKNIEINVLFNRLSHLDSVLQNYIALGRANPFLRNIGNVIDQFIFQEGFLGKMYGGSISEKIPGMSQCKLPLPGSNFFPKPNPELLAYQSVVKLLTGELLGHEPLDPHSGIEPLVKDSKLEIYLVPSSSVKTHDRSSIWKSLFESQQQTGTANNTSRASAPPDVDNSCALNLSKEAMSANENTEAAPGKEQVKSDDKALNSSNKLFPKVVNPPWKNKKQKFRDVSGASLDTDLKPIKIPRLEGALLPPLT